MISNAYWNENNLESALLLLRVVSLHFHDENMFATPISRLRVIAILVGISYLLFAVTMPLKYMYGLPQPNLYVGMAHGWLFMLYIVFAVLAIVRYKWSFKQMVLTFAASVVPFGTFYADYRLFKRVANEEKRPV